VPIVLVRERLPVLWCDSKAKPHNYIFINKFAGWNHMSYNIIEHNCWIKQRLAWNVLTLSLASEWTNLKATGSRRRHTAIDLVATARRRWHFFSSRHHRSVAASQTLSTLILSARSICSICSHHPDVQLQFSGSLDFKENIAQMNELKMQIATECAHYFSRAWMSGLFALSHFTQHCK